MNSEFKGNLRIYVPDLEAFGNWSVPAAEGL